MSSKRDIALIHAKPAFTDANMHDKQLFVLKDMLDKKYALESASQTVADRIAGLKFALHQHKRRRQPVRTAAKA